MLGARLRIRYSPSSLVVAERLAPVAVLVAETCTPCSTAPEASLTTPCRLPVDVCAKLAEVTNKTAKSSNAIPLRDDMRITSGFLSHHSCRCQHLKVYGAASSWGLGRQRGREPTGLPPLERANAISAYGCLSSQNIAANKLHYQSAKRLA